METVTSRFRSNSKTFLKPHQWPPMVPNFLTCLQALKGLSPASMSTFLSHSATAILSSLGFINMQHIFPPRKPSPLVCPPFLNSLALAPCVAGSPVVQASFEGCFPRRPCLTVIISTRVPPPSYSPSHHLGSCLVIFTIYKYLLFTVCLFMAGLPH